MTKPSLILLDMDEVLVDFVGPWLARTRPHIAYDDIMAMDWGKAGNLQSLLDITSEDFIAELKLFPPSWWQGLPWMPGGQELLKLVVDSGVPWAICSAPSACPNSAAGKTHWVADQLGDLGKKKLILVDDKSFLAHPGVILIDDMLRYTEAFRQAGGETVIVPRPWNNGTEAEYEAFKETLRSGGFDSSPAG